MMLKFDDRFIQAINDGTKIKTVRYWREAKVFPHERHFVGGVGIIEIVGVEKMPTHDMIGLVQNDCEWFGFVRGGEMLDYLNQYERSKTPAGPADNTKRGWFIVSFRIVTRSNGEALCGPIDPGAAL